MWNTLEAYELKNARLVALETLNQESIEKVWWNAEGNWRHDWAETEDEARNWAEENPDLLVLVSESGEPEGYVFDEDEENFEIALFGGNYPTNYTTSFRKEN